MLVGAVGIENNTDRNFKDLEEMLGSAKALKRNNEESNGILIGPSMVPFCVDEISAWCFFSFDRCPRYKVGFGPIFCGTDGKPMMNGISTPPRNPKLHGAYTSQL